MKNPSSVASTRTGGRRLVGPAVPRPETLGYRVSAVLRRFLAAAAVSGAIVAVAGYAGQPAGGGQPSSAASAVGASTHAAPPVDAAANSSAPDPNAPEVVAAGDIPDNQVFVPVTPAGGLFTVSVPQGWAQSNAGAATVFTDKFNSVRIDVQPRAAAPDAASTRAQDVPQLQGSTPGFVLGDVQAVKRAAGQALLLTYAATSPADAVTGKSVTEAVERYAFWKDGQEVVLTLSGPKGSDNVDPWRTVTDSFRWQR